MSPLLSRVAMLIGLLLVPLCLAVASQALASRPGAPDVDRAPVRLERGPGQPDQPQPSGSASPSPSPTGPRVVEPRVPGVELDDPDGDPDGDPGGDPDGDPDDDPDAGEGDDG